MITRYYKVKSENFFLAVNENGTTLVMTEKFPYVSHNSYHNKVESFSYNSEICSEQEFLRAYNRTLERIHLATFGNEKPTKSTCNFKVIFKNIKSFITKHFN